MTEGRSIFRVSPQYQPMLRQIGIDGDSIFHDSRIVCWRDIAERQNCILDVVMPPARPVRLHIKRYKRPGDPGAEAEADAISLLLSHGLPTMPLVGWGRSSDGRGFLVTLDLTGFSDAEKAVAAGLPIDSLIEPIAHLTARLHDCHLHHRDLYLCHFFTRDDDPADLRIIDAARVRRLPRWPLGRRWIVKDLAQLVFSLRNAGASETQIRHLLETYAADRKMSGLDRLAARINRKAARIARHDASLRQRQPLRNVSLPPENVREAAQQAK